jgi:hypothetical protein
VPLRAAAWGYALARGDTGGGILGTAGGEDLREAGVVPADAEHDDVGLSAERLHLQDLSCTHAAINQLGDNGAAARDVSQREAHVGRRQEARPRWPAGTNTWSTKHLQRAAIKWERRRRVTVTKHDEVQRWQRWIARTNQDRRWDRRIEAQPWPTDATECGNDQSGEGTSSQTLTHRATR